MTIATSANQISYTGDGVSLAFAFPYPFITTADLKVYVGGVLQSSGYSVAGVAPATGSGTFASGTVTFVAAPAAAATVLIYCDPDLLQSTSLPPNDPFPSKTVEKMIDKSTLQIQRIATRTANTLRAPEGETGIFVTGSAASRAGTVYGFDAAGNYAPVAVQAAGNFTYGQTVIDSFTGDAVTTVFTLSTNPGLQSNLSVFVGGVRQDNGVDFIWTSGTTLTFTTAPPSNVPIRVSYTRALPMGTSDASVMQFSGTGSYSSGTIGRYLVDRIREIGTRCLAIGLLAGAALTAGATDVVAIGPSAGASITTAFGHVLIGTNAGKSITTPAYCVAVGPYALESFDQPSNVNAINTALGAYVLNKAVAGAQYNTGVGGYALQNLTVGYFNTAIGQNSGSAMTIGFSNTFVGHSTGLVMTGACNFNVLIGDNSAFATTLASGMVSIGFQALGNNTTGNSYSIAMGYSPLAQSNSVDPSVAIGKQAGYTLTSAGKAVIVGTLAYLLGNGAQTTAVGHESMGQETSTGTNNSALGYRSGYTSTNALSNTTCLGANTAATRSNQVMLGDLNVTEVRTAGCLIQRLAVTGSTPLDNNLEFAFFYVDNTHFGIKLKGSDGTVRVANGTFAGGGFVLA